MEDYTNLDRYQDILGQLPMLQVYAHVLYFFPTPSCSRQELVDTLSAAITKVRQAVPWMGARVVNTGRIPGRSSGLYRVVACEPPSPPIVVKDVQSQAPSYSAFAARSAPLSMIDASLFTPVPGFPTQFEDSDEDPAHVVRLQVSFIAGGVVLDFVTHHNMVDAGGHFGFVRLMAMALRGEEFPAALLKEVNRDRRPGILFPLLGPDEPMLDHSHHRRRPITAADPLVQTAKAARTHIFRFTGDKLRQLKELASQAEGFDRTVPYITTDDALSAFCWQRVLRARLRLHTRSDSRSISGETPSRFSRTVDGRRALGLSPDYMGDVIHNIATTLPVATVASAPLSTLACALRSRILAANANNSSGYHIRSFATFIANEPDKSTITYGGEFNPVTDFSVSSILARRGEMFVDFGVLGRPGFVRRPPSVTFVGVGVFFPSSGDLGNGEGCDASIGLTDEEFGILEEDEVWRGVVRYIG
ncbi:transferase family-domain-containing protein [Aspergillus falconensis]